MQLVRRKSSKLFLMKKIEELKVGDLFTAKKIDNPKDTQVYVHDGYNRFTKKYSAHKFSDISAFREWKKGTIIYTDFEF
jgi:hypothetical protein